MLTRILAILISGKRKFKVDIKMTEEGHFRIIKVIRVIK